MPSPVEVTNAVRSAIDIRAAIALWNAERYELSEAAIRVAVGIHYGEMDGDWKRKNHDQRRRYRSPATCSRRAP